MKSIASHNGVAATELAFRLLSQGASPLDACVEGVTLIEDDPAELTVGFGGLPNEDGVVELDAAVMDGPTHRGAGVAALRDIRHPTKVARLIMQQTKRVLLVGEGARRFAIANGFKPENLLTEEARRMWLYWKRTRSAHDDWLAPAGEEVDLDVTRWFERHFYGSSAKGIAGTVHCAALQANRDLACATSTSGHAFKLAGRVGDSPVLGAGLYVDNEVGTCGSIGNGEANLENLSSFAGVRAMRDGLTPREAGLSVLRDVARRAHSYERDTHGRATYNLQLFLMNKQGEHAGVAMWSGKQIAVTDESGTRLEDCAYLWEKS